MEGFFWGDVGQVGPPVLFTGTVCLSPCHSPEGTCVATSLMCRNVTGEPVPGMEMKQRGKDLPARCLERHSTSSRLSVWGCFCFLFPI